jgi:hypothetical protein
MQAERLAVFTKDDPRVVPLYTAPPAPTTEGSVIREGGERVDGWVSPRCARNLRESGNATIHAAQFHDDFVPASLLIHTGETPQGEGGRDV